MLSRLLRRPRPSGRLPAAQVPRVDVSPAAGAAQAALPNRPRGLAAAPAPARADAGWEVIVGLELHVQVKAATKLFSRAPIDPAASPNTNVAFFDAALPGTLPALNRRVVQAAACAGLALGGTVHPVSLFDRKHYFYADLPHGYQITQQRQPLVTGGSIMLPASAFMLDDGGAPSALSAASVDGAAPRVLRLQRIQLEMDTGKSTHADAAAGPDGRTRVDLNRAGAALMELVTEPDLRSGAEAAAAVRALQALLRRVGAADANMEDGNLRVDVNVSVRRPGSGSEAGGSGRCEVKNLNSTRSIARAVEAEARRHVAALEAGGRVLRETRSFDVASGTTAPLRDKETALDYRFLPEPDLPPLVISTQEMAELRAQMEACEAAEAEAGAAPDALAARYGLPAGGPAVRALRAEPGAAVFFESVMAAAPQLEAAAVAAWVTGEMLGTARAMTPIPGSPLVSLASLPAGCSPSAVAQLLQLVAAGTLSGRQAKALQAALLAGDARPVPTLAAELCGGSQLRDEAALASLCAAAVAAYPAKAAEYRAGRDRLLGLFVGEVMARSQGRADPPRVTALLLELLGPCVKPPQGADGGGGSKKKGSAPGPQAPPAKK